jgi:hypothetical protein
MLLAFLSDRFSRWECVTSSHKCCDRNLHEKGTRERVCWANMPVRHWLFVTCNNARSVLTLFHELCERSPSCRRMLSEWRKSESRGWWVMQHAWLQQTAVRKNVCRNNLRRKRHSRDAVAQGMIHRKTQCRPGDRLCWQRVFVVSSVPPFECRDHTLN